MPKKCKFSILMDRASKLFNKKMSYEFIFQHLIEYERLKKGTLKDERDFSTENYQKISLQELKILNSESNMQEPKRLRQLNVNQIGK
jgi:hypothetical protein